MSKKIIVRDLIKSSDCYDRESGKLLYKEIVKYIRDDKKVVVDFDGIKSIASTFLSTSFADLLHCASVKDIVKKNIKVVNIDSFSRMILNNVMKSSLESLVYDNPCKDCPYINCKHHP